MSFDDELKEDREPTTPDEDEEEIEDADEEGADNEGDNEGESEERQFTKFAELTDAEYSALPLTERRKYVKRLETHRKRLKRAKVTERKRAQRRRLAAGEPAGTEAKLHVEWQKNRQEVQRPEHAEEFAELKERLAEFNVVHHQTSAAIQRMRNGVHPEDLPGAGRFYEIIGQNLLDLVKRYGMKTVLPIECIPIFVDSKFHAHRAAALQKMKEDPDMHYEMRFGLEITHVSEYDFYHYFENFFSWYLTHRPDPTFDYQWDDSDVIVQNFVIPEKYLHESPGSGIRYVWVRLENFRRGIKHDPKLRPHGHGMTSTSEILENDNRVLKTLRDLGY